ncbi:MAG: ATP-dependent sacrificial sulfur transferase LarE [Actinomycetota bacterium]
MEKAAALRDSLGALPGAIVAYSGGADSAFLADVAHEVLGDRMVAITAVSPSLAPDERVSARGLAASRGWRHEEIFTDELDKADYRRNAPDRCYHCKDTLFDALDALASDRGAAVLVGTNVDDTGDFRPGQRAAREHGVRAPLLEAGLTKEEIRSLSRARGLPTWEKPASACLSSRIAYGVEVTPERLDRVARAEAFMRSLGLRELRVRDHGDLARIEVPGERLVDVAGVHEQITAELKALGFTYVTLDLEGFRSGSMNDVLLSIQRRS